MARRRTLDGAAPSRGRFVNSGAGPTVQPIDIGHEDYLAVIEPDSAFWALVRKDRLADAFATGGKLPASLAKSRPALQGEMDRLRFGLTPSAVYFNPTERCNLDCTYCYIPRHMRRSGRHMEASKLLEAMEILHRHFRKTLPRGQTPQIIFHGAEPLLNRDAVFEAIDRYRGKFLFGVQTNATLLDGPAAEFLTSRRVSIGLSLDAHKTALADRTRRTWDGHGVFAQVLAAMDRLAGYDNWSVICTISSQNVRHLSGVADFFHARRVPTCLMNILRCTLERSRKVKPDDALAARHFIAALEHAAELHRRTGRKLVVGNFANILLAILAPSARRLMCDLSPCGGGRCFFAVAPDGGMFPCSEFIGLGDFRGGNLFTDDIPAVLKTPPFERVTGRRVENIEPCRRCAIRHFCGSPCPAEAHEMNGGMGRTGAFCEFYEEQVRYAFRLIADGRANDFLWDGWDQGLKETFTLGGL